MKDTDAKITLGEPDKKEWDLVGVFSRLSLAISQYAVEQQENPDVPLVIQPYKGGEAGLFRKRVRSV